jgi:GT2 family glycosyltransferase
VVSRTDDSRQTKAHTSASIGAVVLHYRNFAAVQQTLEALLAQTRGATQIVLVDNASDDGSVEQIRAAFPSVHVVESPSNGGYAAGMNLGYRSLSVPCEFVLLLTHECRLAPDALEILADRLDQVTSLGCVGPLLGYLSRPERVYSAGVTFVGPRRRASHLTSPGRIADWKNATPAYCDSLDGACLLLRRKPFEAVGLLDEGYFLYFEETELLYRLQRAGFLVECVPKAIAWQEPGKLPVALFARNRLRFVSRNFTFPVLMLELIAQTVAGIVQTSSLDRARRRYGRLRLRGVAAYLLGVNPERLLSC